MSVEQIFKFLPLVLFIFSIYVVSLGIIRINQDQRGIVFRFGRLTKTLNPGLNVITPFLESVIKVNLTKHIPEWQGLDELVLNKRVVEIVSRDPNPKKYK